MIILTCQAIRSNYFFYQRKDLQNKKTTKQEFHTKNIIVFFLNSFIWTNRKGETKLYFLLVENLHQENKNILDELLVSLFYCFVNPFSGKRNSCFLLLDKLILSLALVTYISLTAGGLNHLFRRIIFSIHGHGK